MAQVRPLKTLRGATSSIPDSDDVILSSLINAVGGSTTGSIYGSSDSTTTTVDIGTGTAVTDVNIGNASATTTIFGNLTVDGTTITVNTQNMTVESKIILMNSDGTDPGPAGASSTLAIERGATGDDALLLWDETNDTFQFGFGDTQEGTVVPTISEFTPLQIQDLILDNPITGSTVSIDASNNGAGLYDNNLDIIAGGSLNLGSSVKTTEINIGEDANAKNITIGNSTGTSSTQINTGTGGFDVNSGGTVAIDGVLIDINATGAITIDSAESSNMTVTGSAQNLTLAVLGGGTQKINIQSAGTGLDAVDINSSVGGIAFSALGSSDTYFNETGDLELNSSFTSVSITSLIAALNGIQDGRVVLNATVSSAAEIKNSYTLGEVTLQYQSTYISDNNEVSLTDASDPTKVRFIGLAQTSGTTGASINIVTEGIESGLLIPGLTVGTGANQVSAGAEVFLALTPGYLTTDISGFGNGDTIYRIGVIKDILNYDGATGNEEVLIQLKPTIPQLISE